MTGKDRFVAYVNKNVGSTLTTGRICESTGISMRRCQMFCKAVREYRPGKVKTVQGAGRTIMYSFKKPIKTTEIKLTD